MVWVRSGTQESGKCGGNVFPGSCAPEGDPSNVGVPGESAPGIAAAVGKVAEGPEQGEVARGRGGI